MAASVKSLVLPITAPQGVFVTAGDPIIGFVAGRGSGKTWVGAYRITTRSQPGDPWLCVSPDAGVVYDTTLPTFIDLVRDLGVYVADKLTPYPRVWWRIPGRENEPAAQILFRSGENPDKLRGPNKAGLWIDEASIQAKSVYTIGRATLRYKGRMGPTLLTMTPRGRSHWTFDLFYRRAEEDEIHDPDVEWIQGVAYKRRGGRSLIQCSTRDNVFLPDEFYDELQTDYSSILAQQELEGLFVDVAGLMLRRQWFKPVDYAPRDAMRIRYWDTAISEIETGSYTAGALIARDRAGQFYIEDVKRGLWNAFDRDTVIHQTCIEDQNRFGGEVLTYIEQQGGSSGREIVDQMIRKLAGFPVYRDVASGQQTRTVSGVELPGKAKIIRAQPFAAQAEAGNVFIVAGGWNNEYLSEMEQFPEGKHSDQVDASAAGLNKIAQLVQPDEVVAAKERIAVDSDRFGQTVAVEQTRRRRLYNTE